MLEICPHAKRKLEVAVAVGKKKKRNTCRTIEDVLGNVLGILGFVSGSRGFIYIEYMDFYFEIIKRNYWIF